VKSNMDFINGLGGTMAYTFLAYLWFLAQVLIVFLPIYAVIRYFRNIFNFV